MRMDADQEAASAAVDDQAEVEDASICTGIAFHGTEGGWCRRPEAGATVGPPAAWLYLL